MIFFSCGDCADHIEGKLTRLLEYRLVDVIADRQAYCDSLKHIDRRYEEMAEKCDQYSEAVKRTRELTENEDQVTLRQFLKLAHGGADCQDLWNGIYKMQTMVATKLAERTSLKQPGKCQGDVLRFCCLYIKNGFCLCNAPTNPEFCQDCEDCCLLFFTGICS